MSELKPCPFCGRSDLLGFEPAERGFLSVRCRACGGQCGGNRAETESEAAATWNHRAQPAKAGRVLTDEQLNNILDFHLEGGNWNDMARAIEAAALAKLAAREPVAVLHRGEGGVFRVSFGDHLWAVYALPQGDHDLFTHAPDDTALIRQMLNNICGAKLCEFNSMSSRQEMIRLLDAAIAAAKKRLGEPT